MNVGSLYLQKNNYEILYFNKITGDFADNFICRLFDNGFVWLCLQFV